MSLAPPFLCFLPLFLLTHSLLEEKAKTSVLKPKSWRSHKTLGMMKCYTHNFAELTERLSAVWLLSRPWLRVYYEHTRGLLSGAQFQTTGTVMTNQSTEIDGKQLRGSFQREGRIKTLASHMKSRCNTNQLKSKIQRHSCPCVNVSCHKYVYWGWS